MNNMLSVIIPAYNEEENIPRIEKELIPVLDTLKTRFEIIVVDDGSRDGTAKRVGELKKRHREIVLVKHGINKGLGAAVITGISHRLSSAGG
ncbi:MAG: glycosyltransferase family 2 protein [Candidatus Aenigmarchaeota archaeon]|nr:glycosyltransferase family 2 protein [Candidatus Aenigmarchaeota archaeon]